MDAHETLGVSPDATSEEVTQAYRRLALAPSRRPPGLHRRGARAVRRADGARVKPRVPIDLVRTRGAPQWWLEAARPPGSRTGRVLDVRSRARGVGHLPVPGRRGRSPAGGTPFARHCVATAVAPSVGRTRTGRCGGASGARPCSSPTSAWWSTTHARSEPPPDSGARRPWSGCGRGCRCPCRPAIRWRCACGFWTLPLVVVLLVCGVIGFGALAGSDASPTASFVPGACLVGTDPYAPVPCRHHHDARLVAVVDHTGQCPASTNASVVEGRRVLCVRSVGRTVVKRPLGP